MTRLRLTATLTVLIGTAALLGATTLFAAHSDTQAPKSAPDLKALIEKVESTYGGQVLEIEREHGIYEVELLGKDGQEQEIHVNAAGEKVSFSEHHDKHDKH